MFKKLVIAGASAALVLGMTVPAFAKHDNHHSSGTSNSAYVKTHVNTVADTGGNDIHGFVVSGNPSIVTGTAKSGTLTGHLVNTNLGSGSSHNNAYVKTNVDTGAYTGGNEISGGMVSGGYIQSGNATAGSAVIDVVNTNLNFH